MSFIDKLLSSIGHHSISISTKLYKNKFNHTDTIEGVITITGDNSGARIKDINLSLETFYFETSEDVTHVAIGVIKASTIPLDVVLDLNEVKEVPFKFIIPPYSPTTRAGTNIYLQSQLTFEDEVELEIKDKTYITILSSPVVNKVLKALEELWFIRVSANCVLTSEYNSYTLPFIQEFDFLPQRVKYKENISLVKVSFIVQSDDTVVVVLNIFRKVENAHTFRTVQKEECLVVPVGISDVTNIYAYLEGVLNKYFNQ
jgi:sporulation-control protein